MYFSIQLKAVVERYAIFLTVWSIFLVGIILQLDDVEPRIFFDSEEYFRLAAEGLRWESLFQMRPFFAVLFLKPFLGNANAYSIFQAAIYAISWGYLFFVLNSSVKSKFLLIAACIVLLYFSLCEDFVFWAKVVLTESISVSLTILSLAFFIQFVDKGKRLHFYLLIATLIIGANYRDLSAYYSVFYIFPIFFAFLWRSIGRRDLLIGGTFIGVAFLFVILSSNNAGEGVTDTRWYASMLNNMGKRILVK